VAGCLTTNDRLILRPSCSHDSSPTVTPVLITWLFEEVAFTHFLLDSSVLDELTESLDSIIHIFVVAQTQLNHQKPPVFVKNQAQAMRRISN
jgi:hypothetical protein